MIFIKCKEGVEFIASSAFIGLILLIRLDNRSEF